MEEIIVLNSHTVLIKSRYRDKRFPGGSLTRFRIFDLENLREICNETNEKVVKNWVVRGIRRILFGQESDGRLVQIIMNDTGFKCNLVEYRYEILTTRALYNI